MKKNLILVSLTICIGILAIGGCKKENEEKPGESNISELLKAHDWISQSMPFILEDEVPNNESYNLFQDLTLVIAANGTFHLSSSNSQLGELSNGIWSLRDDNTVILASDGNTGSSFRISINFISENSLQISFSYTYSGIIEAVVIVETMCVPLN